MKNTRKNDKMIDEICSLGSSLTMIIALALLAKYHNHWQVVLGCIIVFLFGFVAIVFFVTRMIRKSKKKKNEENIVSDNSNPQFVCPKCGGKLVIRTARKGANAGSQFYGCFNYPNCKYTKDL